MNGSLFDVIIVGSGPAGLTAAIYTTRANLKTLVVAGEKWGGQLMLTTGVENFPGFADGIQGPDLMLAMRKQAEKHGAEIIEQNFTRLHLPSAKADGGQENEFTVEAGGKTYQTRSVIIATGADTKWLDVPGEKERIGRGVSSCAPCDAPFFRDKTIIVAGGGDSAMEEALVLTRFARHVTIVHRRDTFRASAIMVEKAKANEKISFLLNQQITQIYGEPNVKGVKLTDVKTGETKDIAIDGVFVAIGHIPNTMVFTGIELDSGGYIIVHDHSKTNMPGVFVAGDVHDTHYRQAITAAGYGCAAALEAERFLEMQKS